MLFIEKRAKLNKNPQISPPEVGGRGGLSLGETTTNVIFKSDLSNKTIITLLPGWEKVHERRMRVDIILPLTHFSKLISFVKKNFPLPQGARGMGLGGVKPCTSNLVTSLISKKVRCETLHFHFSNLTYKQESEV